MPWPKKSKQKADRVVRHKLVDGTIKEYRYASFKPKIQRKRDTLSDLIDDYKDSPEWRALAAESKRVYTLYLKPLDKVGHLDPGAVTRRDIITTRNAIAATRGNGASSGFIRAAGALFKWAVECDMLEHSPVNKIKHLVGGHITAWTPAQAARALTLLPEHLRRVVIMALYTGQRRSDLCAMRWSAYDGSNIRLTQIKTATSLVIPAHPVLKAELDAWKQERTIALTILTHSKGGPWRPHGLTEAMRQALRKIGMDDINVHGLRKLAAANLADAGCSTREIGAITGHKTSAMIDLYTKSADQERLANAAIMRLTRKDGI
jgi:integrase